MRPKLAPADFLVRPLHSPPAVTHQLDGTRDRAEAIAREADALRMEAFRSPVAIRAKRKATDLVTDLDERCESLLRDRLSAAFPGTAIVGEEAGGQRRGGAVWYVEP